MAIENTTEAAAVEAPKAEKPQSLREKLTESVTEKWQRAATEESAAETTPAAEAATPDGSEGTTAETPATTEAAAEATPVTPEQLADPAFWGKLDKAGWERMEREFPVQTKHVKAAQAAATRIVNAARSQQPAAAPAAEQPVEKKTSPELQEAIRKANSLDENEAAEGLQAIVELTLPTALQKFGINTEESKAEALEQLAYAQVVAETPEIAEIPTQAIGDYAATQPALLNLLRSAQAMPDEARVAITANVIRLASSAVMEKQKAEQAANDAKKNAQIERTRKQQATVRSNAANPANVVVESPSGGAPTTKADWKQNVINRWNDAAAGEGQ